MPVGLPQYYIGRHLTNARVTPVIFAANGTYTKGAAQDIAALNGAYLTFDDCVFDQRVDSEEISPANLAMRNHVPMKDDFEVTLREIKYSDPTLNAIPASGWVGYDNFLVEVVVQPYGSNSSNPYTVQAMCSRMSLNDPYGEGKSDFELHGQACGLPIAYIARGQALVY